MTKNKTVYIGMSADLIHPGHLNIINKASKLGDVIIGLLTDRAIATYKRVPIMEYKDRNLIVSALKNVKKVIKQETHDYTPNLNKLRPDYVVHGDDWKKGSQVNIRNKVISELKKWGGKLIEFPYTKEISSTKLISLMQEIGTTPDIRRKQLRKILHSKKLSRFLDIHNGLSALIVENTKITLKGKVEEFDGMWGSSLTNSTAKGKPDIEAVDFSERVQLLNEVLEVTTKPIIFDGDTGGKIEHFVFTIKTLERLGVSAIIIEDKTGLKKNSLFGTSVKQKQDSTFAFSKKIKAGKNAQATKEFMIIARIESLIMGKSIEDALLRAKKYLKAGADGIMIHTSKKNPHQIFAFCRAYNKFKNRRPLIVVPSSFSQVSEKKLEKEGVNIVIYANHLLRSVYPNMLNTAKSILKNKRALEIEKKLLPINDILELIPGTK